MGFIPPTSSNNQLNQLVAGYKKESTEGKENTSSDQLPTEAFSKILSFLSPDLSPENFQSIASVSKNWTKSLIESTKLVELSKFKTLASFLERQFKETNLKTKQEILQHTNDAIHRSIKTLEEVIKNLPNLSSLKKRLLEDKDSTVAILQNLEKDDISALKTQAYGVDMPEGVFELAGAYKLLDEAHKITDFHMKNTLLYTVFMIVSKKGYFVKKALNITKLMSDGYDKTKALFKMSMAMLKRGNYKKAIKIAKLITDNKDKCNALFEMSMAVLESGNHEKAKEIAKLIPDNKYKSKALSKISIAVLKSGDHEKALKLANLITDNMEKCNALFEMSMAVLKSGDHEEAIKIANLITHDGDKYSALSKISIAVLKSGDHEKALKIAKLIPDCNYKSRALSEISMAMLESGDHEKALKIAKLIPDNFDDFIDREYRYEALFKISMAVLKSGDHEEAIKIANLIPGNSRDCTSYRWKSKACSEIYEAIKAVLESEDHEKALKLANLMPDNFDNSIDSDYKSRALYKISMAVLESGDHEKALKIANLIPDCHSKEKALSEVCIGWWDIEKAIELARLLPKKEDKCQALHLISTDLIHRKHIDKALLVINLFPEETDEHKSLLLSQVSKILNDDINTYKAIEVANLIPSDEPRKEAFNAIRENSSTSTFYYFLFIVKMKTFFHKWIVYFKTNPRNN